MENLTELMSYDFEDTKWVPNGYDEIQVPTATDYNFQTLTEKYNELVVVVNLLIADSEEKSIEIDALKSSGSDLK